MIKPGVTLLTGIPRSGTTLCCHILNNNQDTLALHEPMSPQSFDRVAGPEGACKDISDFVLFNRDLVLSQGLAISRHRAGIVPDNLILADVGPLGLRQPDIMHGKIDVSERNLTPQFHLVLKHNALFTALLPQLKTDFSIIGIIRNPLAVLASWSSVDLPVNRGRIPAGEMYAPALKAILDITEDTIKRQVIVLEWFFTQYACHLPECGILRYEDFVTAPCVVAKTVGVKFRPIVMGGGGRSSRNATYKCSVLESLYNALLVYGDAIWQFYSRDEIDSLYEQMSLAS